MPSSFSTFSALKKKVKCGDYAMKIEKTSVGKTAMFPRWMTDMMVQHRVLTVTLFFNCSSLKHRLQEEAKNSALISSINL